MKIQNILPLTADLSSQSEEKVESDECNSSAATAAASSVYTDGIDETGDTVDSLNAKQQINDELDKEQEHGHEQDDEHLQNDESLMQQQQQEQHHAEDDDDINMKELEASQGKKQKTTRKKRSLNWEEAERSLLVEVVKPKVDCVENRSVDAKSVKSKRLSWVQITKQFNSLNFRQRSLEQIQVQWRAMKNSAKRDYHQKYPKDDAIEGIKLVEFIEEMHKDPEIGRSHSRGNVSAQLIKEKKVLTDIDDDDDDDDTPLASLPTSANSNSEDTLQTSTMALPSPPLSGDSHNDNLPAGPSTSGAKKKATKAKGKPKKNTNAKHEFDDEAVVMVVEKPKRNKRQRNIEPVVSSDDEKPIIAAAKLEEPPIHPSPISVTKVAPNPDDEKVKRQYIDLLKRARLTEMDHARREHEQRMRFCQIEQDMKMHFLRQERELQLLQQKEEHEKRLQIMQMEHEMRMKIYNSASNHLDDDNNRGLMNSY